MSNNDLPCNKCGGQHHPAVECFEEWKCHTPCLEKKVLENQVDALNISIGILNNRLMTAMELLRRWNNIFGDDCVFTSRETDEFLNQQTTNNK